MRFVAMACVVAAAATCASAAPVNYPALDASFSAPGGVEVSTSVGPVAFAAGQGFVDADSGSPSAASIRYYGGIISYTPNGSPDWGGGLRLVFTRDDGTDSALRFGKPSGGTNWHLQGQHDVGQYGTGLAASGQLPFVIKVLDQPWNIAEAHLFIGAAAEAETEGTANGYVQLLSPTIAGARVEFVAADWATAPSAGSLQGFFSSEEWTPVVVPEPASLSLLALGALLLGRRRNA